MDETPEQITARVFLTAFLQEQLKPVLAALAGYESALIAILRALDANGALAASEAKAAIDAAYALLTDENKKSGQGLVLRQLSSGLAPPQRRH